MAVDRNSDLLRLLPQGEETEQAIAAYELANDVAEQLRRLRKQAGLNQAQLARKLGIGQSRISQLESGLVDHAPSLEMIARFAVACGAAPMMSFAPLGAAEAYPLTSTSDEAATTAMALAFHEHGAQDGFSPSAPVAGASLSSAAMASGVAGVVGAAPGLLPALAVGAAVAGLFRTPAAPVAEGLTITDPDADVIIAHPENLAREPG